MKANDKVRDIQTGEHAVIMSLNTHYYLKKSKDQRPYADPLATIQYVADGSVRGVRVSRLQKVEG